MPHLPPIEVDGGSVTIKFPVVEPNGDRLTSIGKGPAAPPHADITIERFRDSQDGSRIYLIEIHAPGRDAIRFAPQDGRCSIKIHYLSQTEVDSGEKIELPPGTIPLP